MRGKDVTVSIYDGRGQLRFHKCNEQVINGYATANFDCSSWSDALYIAILKTESEVLNAKFIKQ
ncbi:MAG: T9SS type A sorting domain-containing protein [Bacteroidetes bacterium]|nr:T9SS type A sorting domain-containing protein [Bacteroidota bacterium]